MCCIRTNSYQISLVKWEIFEFVDNKTKGKHMHIMRDLRQHPEAHHREAQQFQTCKDQERQHSTFTEIQREPVKGTPRYSHPLCKSFCQGALISRIQQHQNRTFIHIRGHYYDSGDSVKCCLNTFFLLKWCVQARWQWAVWQQLSLEIGTVKIGIKFLGNDWSAFTEFYRG